MSATELLAPQVYADRIIEGQTDAVGQAALERFFAGEGETAELMAAADRVRRHVFGNDVHLCSIVNAKMGGCPEDCGFCSQSKHFATHVGADRFISNQEIVDASAKALSQGAGALGLVTATRGLEDGSKALDLMVDGVKAVREAGHTEAHASFGFVTEDGLQRLKDAGLTEFNHNLETGRGYFDKIVSTHTYDERIETIRAAQKTGLRTCVGGIMGMGEEPKHRAELAVTLRELDVDEVPINFLVSIDGTKLEQVEPLTPMEMLRIIAVFRLALPRQNIFIAAGRTHLGQLQPLMFGAGASGMMVGDFLTTPNRSVQDDLSMLDDLGLQGHACGDPRPEMERPKPAKRLPVVA
jgi:biotin synthase